MSIKLPSNLCSPDFQLYRYVIRSQSQFPISASCTWELRVPPVVKHHVCGSWQGDSRLGPHGLGSKTLADAHTAHTVTPNWQLSSIHFLLYYRGVDSKIECKNLTGGSTWLWWYTDVRPNAHAV